jgi:hypothetical protein
MDRIDSIIDMLQEVHSLIKTYLSKLRTKTSLPKEKQISGSTSFKTSQPGSKLNPDDCKFLDKIIHKLNEHPSEFKELIYLVER